MKSKVKSNQKRTQLPRTTGKQASSGWKPLNDSQLRKMLDQFDVKDGWSSGSSPILRQQPCRFRLIIHEPLDTLVTGTPWRPIRDYNLPIQPRIGESLEVTDPAGRYRVARVVDVRFTAGPSSQEITATIFLVDEGGPHLVELELSERLMA